MEEGMRFVSTRLGLKVMVWISGAVLSIFTLFMVIMLRAEARQAMDWSLKTGVLVSRTVEKGMEQSMNQGDMKSIQTMVENVSRASAVTRLRVVNEVGKVTRSSAPAEVGSVAQEALRGRRVRTLIDPAGGTLRIWSPLLNIGTCVECHQKAAAGEPLGLLDMTLSIAEEESALARSRRLMILWGFIMVVVVSATLFVLLHRLVLRHLAALSRAAGLMASGNTRAAVDIRTADEIGLLGQAFNRMAVNVNDAHEKNESLIQGISDPLMTVDVSLAVTFMNGPMETLTGYRREEAVGKLTCREILRCVECDNGCILRKIVQGLETTATARMTVIGRSGKATPVVSSDSVLRDSLGRIVGAISIMRDVTREQEAEAKLADEVSWSASVITAIADPIFTVDADKNITFLNGPAAAISGYTREEAVGQKCYRIFRGDICREGCIYDRALREGVSVHNIDRTLNPKEGPALLTQAAGSVLKTADRKGSGFLEIVRDVSEERSHVDNLVDILTHIRSAAETVISMARYILQNSEEQKRSVSEQSSSVKEVATTIEELDITSQQTAEKAEKVVETAQKTVQISRDGQMAVEGNIEVMKVIRSRVESIAEQILDLSQQAQQIGSIITAVNDLAEQTNLLALNAAIEAARAGEHGRGFTVVAMEVKKLAEQSQAATAKIANLITEIQEATRTCVQVTEEGARGVEEGVRLAGTAGETIQKAMGNIADTADAVQQIATIAKQQSVGIQQVSVAMTSINAGMNQTTQSAERLRETAESFSHLAAQLNELVRKYKLLGQE
jgi:PAS domain S-box-containing protein